MIRGADRELDVCFNLLRAESFTDAIKKINALPIKRLNSVPAKLCLALCYEGNKEIKEAEKIYKALEKKQSMHPKQRERVRNQYVIFLRKQGREEEAQQILQTLDPETKELILLKDLEQKGELKAAYNKIILLVTKYPQNIEFRLRRVSLSKKTGVANFKDDDLIAIANDPKKLEKLPYKDRLSIARYVTQNNFSIEAGKKILLQLMAEDKTDPNPRLYHLFHFENPKDPEPTIRGYKSLIKSFPEHAKARFRYANFLHLTLGRYDESIPVYKAAEKLAYEKKRLAAKIYNQLSIVYQKLNNESERDKYITLALKADPTYAAAHSTSARLKLDYGLTQKAYSEYSRAYELNKQRFHANHTALSTREHKSNLRVTQQDYGIDPETKAVLEVKKPTQASKTSAVKPKLKKVSDKTLPVNPYELLVENDDTQESSPQSSLQILSSKKLPHSKAVNHSSVTDKPKDKNGSKRPNQGKPEQKKPTVNTSPQLTKSKLKLKPTVNYKQNNKSCRNISFFVKAVGVVSLAVATTGLVIYNLTAPRP